MNATAFSLDLCSNGSRVRAMADGWTDGHYQTYYPPCFVVDNEGVFELIKGMPLVQKTVEHTVPKAEFTFNLN